MTLGQGPFMRVFVDLWLGDRKIIGTGDDGQREGGLTLAQEAVYFRLCLTQFRQPDGYLPNRKAFLCDASACAIASYETLVAPVLASFFRRTKDGSRIFNPRVRDEWESANSKGVKARAAAEERWRKRRERIVGVDADAHADAHANAPCKRESERDNEEETDLPAVAGATPAKPANPWPAAWSREAVDDWRERFQGTAPGGQIGKALSGLKATCPEWSEVRRRWRIYLAATEAQFAAPSRFAATFGAWDGAPSRNAQRQPSGGNWDTPEVSERAREYAREDLPADEVARLAEWDRKRILAKLAKATA